MGQQQSFTEALKEWETFLGKSARRYIRIKDLKTMKWVKKGETSEMPTRFFMIDALKDHSSFEDWFNDLMLNNDLENIVLNFKIRSGGSGSANVPGYQDKTYNLAKRLQFLRSGENQTPAEPIVPVKNQNQNAMQENATPYYNPAPQPTYNGSGLGGAVLQQSGGLMAAAHAAGLGLSDFIDLKKSAELGTEYKKDLEKLKQENERLISDNRDLKSQVDHAERDKEISLKLAKLEKSGFMDSEAGQRILASLPEMIPLFLQQKKEGQPQLGMGGAAQLSEAKTRLVEFISDPGVTDPVAELLEQVLAHLASKPNYANELEMLNKRQGQNGYGNG